MVLKTGPVPRVATGEIIEENWGDSVAQSLNNLTELTDYVVWSPAGGDNYDADKDGLMTQWFVMGGATPEQLYVPEWATNAFADIQICGVQNQPTGGGRTGYLLQLRIGSLVGRQVRYSGQAGWFGLGWGSSFANIEDIAGGDRSVKVFAQRIENTGGADDRWRLNDQGDVAVRFMFTQAVDWYPGL